MSLFKPSIDIEEITKSMRHSGLNIFRIDLSMIPDSSKHGGISINRFQNLNKKLKVPSGIKILWMVSIIIEPMTFFSVVNQTGIGGHAGRIIQLIVCLYLLIHFTYTTTKANNFYLKGLFLYFPFIIFNVYMTFLMVLNLLAGSYSLGFEITSQHQLDTSFFTPQIRTFVELIIIWFQLFYFIILAPIFLQNDKDFKILFKILIFIILANFLFGYIDFLLSQYNSQFIPRTIRGGEFVGRRFHGIIGEPRDSAMYSLSLFFYYALFTWYKKNAVEFPPIFWMLIILLSVVLGYSMSALFSIIFYAFILIAFVFKAKDLLNGSIFLLVLVLAGILFIAPLVPRMNDYMDGMVSLIDQVGSLKYDELSHQMQILYPNLFPIDLLISHAGKGDFFQILFGFGLGGSGVSNATFYGYFNNPTSQLVRLLYEAGLVGTALFIFSFKISLERCSKYFDAKGKRRFLYCGFLVLACTLAHRSNVWLPLFGIMTALWNFKCPRQTN